MKFLSIFQITDSSATLHNYHPIHCLSSRFSLLKPPSCKFENKSTKAILLSFVFCEIFFCLVNESVAGHTDNAVSAILGSEWTPAFISNCPPCPWDCRAKQRNIFKFLGLKQPFLEFSIYILGLVFVNNKHDIILFYIFSFSHNQDQLKLE